MLDTTTAPVIEAQDVRAIALLDMYTEGVRVHIFLDELLLTPFNLPA